MPHVDPASQAKLFRGLADPARLTLLLALRHGPCSAGELARDCSLSASNASNHLQCLLECGLVAVEAQGRHNLYSLADPLIAGLLEISERIVGGPAGVLIEACRNYGAPSRRSLRVTGAEPRVVAGKVVAPRAVASRS
ncbi:MAG: helix-turn-helix domain-containing protein [Dehalococcoidia bacterium]|nr:helix-turn-helix domain-containing protein [Dehalococcoidia bacterium]